MPSSHGQALNPGNRGDPAALSMNSYITMKSRFIGVSFGRINCKWFGRVTLAPADKAGLPEHLKVKTELRTDSHEDEEDAAFAADKWVPNSGLSVIMQKFRPLYDLVPYRLLYKLGRPTNGLLSEADLDLVDDISWTAL